MMNSGQDFQICRDVTGLKDFLRLSHSLVDDTITQNLNNLVLPVRFDPTSTGTPKAGERRLLRTPIDEGSCNTLVDAVFRNWEGRSHTIDRCLQFADANVAKLNNVVHANTDQQNIRELNKQRRLDPYAGRTELEEPMLTRVLKSEQSTEAIIRDRTWRILRNRCQALSRLPQTWETAFVDWQTNHATPANAAST
ncbi:caffeine-induced death protein 2 [Protomyces lactucae-debilis]|uniref:Caffeine-induced death protein 2 n=1 Tax=Protomyces lactucae-debilis TaxID=2754530 RepID=A0A1Y2EQN7_PROLT|nr:caffeine-induced death protein 2 [Protomyces lactucae-debilis]ORY73900.1 caffeine-induced death protein 2 [Protomyces lactucae-debilis]